MSEIEPLEFEAVTLSFARWILTEKRRKHPRNVFVVGVNGSIGQGKTFFSHAVTAHLNALLAPEEGIAFTRSLDDYYLPKADRYTPEFLERGYHPPGIPNRGPAGTHDTSRLWQDIQKLEQNLPIEWPSFDKQADDRSSEFFRIEKTVGVFILEGWFVGARTTIDALKTDPGLRRSVALALPRYKPIFDRLDALWAFEPPRSTEEMIAQRLEQQVMLDRKSGRPGMTLAQIRLFIDYFYQDAWQPGVTSPLPPPEKVTFLAKTDLQHRILRLQPSL